MNIALAVVSDLYLAGYTEDGTPFEGERYFVEAEAEDGRRWRFFRYWNGVEVSTDDEGIPHFGDRRPQAKNLADAVCRTLERDGVNVRDGKWDESRPCYGSEAWEAAGGDYDEIMREREEG